MLASSLPDPWDLSPQPAPSRIPSMWCRGCRNKSLLIIKSYQSSLGRKAALRASSSSTNTIFPIFVFPVFQPPPPPPPTSAFPHSFLLNIMQRAANQTCEFCFLLVWLDVKYQASLEKTKCEKGCQVKGLTLNIKAVWSKLSVRKGVR